MFKSYRALVRGGALGVIALIVAAAVTSERIDDALGIAVYSAPWIALLGALALAVHAPTPRRLAWVRRCGIVVGVLLLLLTLLCALWFTPVALVPAFAAVVPLTATRGATERGAAIVGIYAGAMSTLVAAAWGGWALIAPLALTIGAFGWARQTRAPGWTPELPRATVRA